MHQQTFSRRPVVSAYGYGRKRAAGFRGFQLRREWLHPRSVRGRPGERVRDLTDGRAPLMTKR